MIAFYVLVSVMPFVQHPFWSYFVGDLTVVKITGVLCLMYAYGNFIARPSAPPFFRTWQARWAVVLCLIGMASYLTMGARVPFTLSPFMSYASFLSLFFIALIVVDSVQRLRWVLLVALGSVAYACLHILREWQKYGGFAAGYRPGWVTGDPNYFTLSALLCLPFAFYLLRPRQPRWERYFCLGCLGLMVIGITLASSRGGFLGLTAGVLLAAIRSRHRLKVLALALGLLLPIMVISPSSPVTRLLSPDHSDRESTELRTALWRAGLRMVDSSPLTGIGVGNFKPLVRRFSDPDGPHPELIAHNTYLGIAAEMGIPALLVFLGILVATFRSTEAARRAARACGHPFVERAAEAMQVGFLSYAVAIFFVSAEYHKLFWLLVFLSACLPVLARARLKAPKTLRRASRSEDISAPLDPAPPTPPRQPSRTPEGTASIPGVPAPSHP